VYAFAKHVPVVLAGLKIDVRSVDKGDPRRIVAFEEGKRMARDIGAVAYVECSAKSQQGLKEVFDQVTRAAIHPRRVERRPSGTVMMHGGVGVVVAPTVDTSTRESCCACRPKERRQ
jgi:Ras family protein